MNVATVGHVETLEKVMFLNRRKFSYLMYFPKPLLKVGLLTSVRSGELSLLLQKGIIQFLAIGEKKKGG